MKFLFLITVLSFSIPSFAKVNEVTATLIAKAYVQALGVKGVNLGADDLTKDFENITYCDNKNYCDTDYKFMVNKGECVIFVTVSYEGKVINSSNGWTCVAIPE